MAKAGQVVPIKLSKLEQKSLLKFLEEMLKGLDREKENVSEREFELSRKMLKQTTKKVRKASPGETFTLDAVNYQFLKASLSRVVEHNRTAFKDMFFLKRWFMKLLSKNYEHLLQVIERR